MTPPSTSRPAPRPTFEGRPLPCPDEPVFDQGLAFDVETLVSRRQLLRAFGFGALGTGLFIAGCGPGATTTPAGSAGSSFGASLASCVVIPEETEGPFPGDGSNGPNALTQSGVVRRDIRSSFGASTNTAAGVPLRIRFAILDQANGCAPIPDAAVYVWHCDRDGNYSMYSQAAANENYLRGVQPADANGVVTFDSIVPGCYAGRWPHIHFEVYPNLAAANDTANKIATSQIALPKATCDEVYATAGYEASTTNLQGISLQSDSVFGDDGGVHELGTVSGSVASGLTVDLAVPIAVAG